MDLLRERGADVDNDAKRRGVQILDFEKRWTSEIAIEKLAAKNRRQPAKKLVS